MHTPTPDPHEDEEEPDVKHPPVPPDQEPDVVPQREPPNPDESHPMIAADSRLPLFCVYLRSSAVPSHPTFLRHAPVTPLSGGAS